MSFDERKARAALDTFCRTRNVQPSTVAVVGHLDAALTTTALKGPDVRWRTIPFWCPSDDPGQSLFGYEFRAAPTDFAQTLYERILQIETRKRRMATPAWLETNSVVPVSRWARFSRAMRDALDAGVGWVVPVRGELLRLDTLTEVEVLDADPRRVKRVRLRRKSPGPPATASDSGLETPPA